MSSVAETVVPIDEQHLPTALRLHEAMLRIRAFEERVSQLFEAGELPGFVHLSIGQESVAAGVIGALRESDLITATHRGHGHIIAKGGRFGPMMAELFGKSTGYCKGKGGSMHIFDMALGVLGANGILGAGQPIAVGAAMSAKMRGTDDVAVTFFGEGASVQGAVHEAMNLASITNAPVVFIAEVNGYAELTPYATHVKPASLAVRAQAYDMPGEALDGRDVLDVHEAATRLVERARNGEGPSLLEVRTLRWRGHFEGDQQRYRDQSYLEEQGISDPLAHVERRLAASGVAPEEVRAVHDRISAELDEAVEEARQAPLPAPEDSLEDVYSMPLAPAIRS